MNIRQLNFLRRKTFMYTRLTENEHPVQAGLSITPSQMLDMTQRGLPINPQNVNPELFSDTDFTKDNDFTIKPELQRGVTMSGLWETSQDAKSKIRNARNKVKQQNLE